MDYSNFSITDYFRLTPHFRGLSDLLLRKVIQIGNYDRLFMFGFSFGARLCFDVGARVGANRIDKIDGCDPAGPAFDGKLKSVDPKYSAKNVQCINTSVSKGTSIYNCHQNFRMGKCGSSQPGATVSPFGSHGLCPYYYNAAFRYTFTPNNYYNCTSTRRPAAVPEDYRMGYMELHQK